MDNSYAKGGTSGIKGVDLQLKLLIIFLLNALKTLKNWKLSTENKRAGKFDDIVLEWPDGAILLQAKHRETKKKISFEELISTNFSKDDFSLPKYFLTFQEVKNNFPVKNVIICTNAFVDKETLNYIEPCTCNSDSILYNSENMLPYYNFNEKILRELKEKVLIYHQRKTQSKTSDDDIISDENLEEFLQKLQFYPGYAAGEHLETTIRKMLERFKNYGNITFLDLYNKIKYWYEQTKGMYVTENVARSLFCEINSEKYCETLEQYNIFFEEDNFLNSSENLIHIYTNAEHLLQVIKIHHALKSEEKNKVLYLNPEDDATIQKETVKAFYMPQYTHMVVAGPKIKDELTNIEISKHVRDILAKFHYKKVILVSETSNYFARTVKSRIRTYTDIEGVVSFTELTVDTKKALIKKKTIFFQGNITSLEELCYLESLKDYAKTLDIKVLEKLVKNEPIHVASNILPLDENIDAFYINRELKSIDEDSTEIYTEDNIYQVDEKSILISDSAGMGKSTVLTKIATSIKQNHPQLWVIRLELSNYTSVLKEFSEREDTTINIRQVLDSLEATRLKNKLEDFVFAMQNKVVLMLDAVDEISPDYTELIVNLIVQCQKSPNFAKIFITTRPHISSELQKDVQARKFELRSFTKQNQIDFLTSYWKKYLDIDENNIEKCQNYAKALITNMSYWTRVRQYNRHFTTIPLHVRMLAEIFQEKNKINSSTDWETCKEYLEAEGRDARVPEKIDLTELYDMFIEKKRQVFINKGNPNGNTYANKALIEQFEECMKHHRALALEVIAGKKVRAFFSCCKETKRDMDASILKIGIVQKTETGFNFAHRTFAEYFVAESLLKELQRHDKNLEVQAFFLENVLVHRDYRVTVTFLDNFLKQVLDSLPSTTFKTYKQSRQYYRQEIKLSHFTQIHYIAHEGWLNILKLLFKCIDYKPGPTKDMLVEDMLALLGQYKSKTGIADNILNLLRFVLHLSGVNVRRFKGNTPLYYAAENGHAEMVEFLINHGANVNYKSFRKKTPLHLAINHEHFETVKVLVKHKADMKNEDHYGNTPLSLAMKKDSVNITTFLFESILKKQGLSTKDTLMLHAAAYLGRLDLLKSAIDKGADINTRVRKGETLIFSAARGGQEEVLKYLVAKGADINSRDDYGNTALYIICRSRQLTSTVKLLMELGIDIDSKNLLQDTALHKAARVGIQDMVEVLVENGADIHMKDDRGKTALCWAALRGYKDIVRYLLSKGADINGKDKNGLSVLHLAARNRDSDMIRLLPGFDTEVSDDEGFTLLHLFSLRNMKNVVELLVECGADVNSTDNCGRTALHLATARGEHHVVQTLLALGAKVDVKDKNDCTPLDLALLLGQKDTLKLLIAHESYVNIKDCRMSIFK